MKTRLLSSICLFHILTVTAFSQGTAFTYQGRLNDGAAPANGRYDLRCSLFDASAAGNQLGAAVTNLATTVSNGLFTVALDFGNQFLGASNWLEVAARTNGASNFTTLSPRQALTPTPYAITAEGVISGGVTTRMLATGAVTGDKLAAGAVKSSQIDDGGSAGFDSFQQAAQSSGGDSTLGFSDLAVVTTTLSAPSFTLAINGVNFGSVLAFSGSETMSKPYSFAVEAQGSGAPINPDTEIGASGNLTFARNGRTTAFGGIVTACSISGSNATGLVYLFRLEPSLAYLDLASNYRIFQNMSVTDVVTKVYLELTGNSFVTSLSGTYGPHETIVQYRETTLNFASRLMEEEGIYYFFNHTSGQHSLILGDNSSAYLAAPNSPFIYHGEYYSNSTPGAEYIRSFQKAYHQSTLRAVVSSYNFETPTTSLTTTNIGSEGTGESFEIAGPVGTLAYNQQIAVARQERHNMERALSTGKANAPDLRPGYTFTLTDQSSAGVGGSYLVTSVHHAGFVRVTNGVTTLYYGNEFEAIPASQNFRPPLKTPRPLAQPCNAVVTGPAGSVEPEFTDKFGRVNVQFKWDRSGITDENSSGWLRVVTPMAGTNRGMIFLPRMGDEVLVSFVEGDPDQPIVIGSLYNNSRLPPYSLPGNKTASGIRTVGTDGQVNEIKFEDEAANQALTVSAARDLTLQAQHQINVNSPVIAAAPVSIGTSSSLGLVEISSSGNIASPQLRIDQTVTGDFARIRMAGGTTGLWDIAAGGGSPNVLNFYATPAVGGAGTNILTLQPNGNASLWGTLAQGSDRAHKTNVMPISAESVLDKVSALPISQWSYTSEQGVNHIGPMAQDFYSSFGLGADAQHITTIDEGGVALAAIQALTKRVEALTTDLKRRDLEKSALTERLDKIEKLLDGKTQSAKP